MKFEELKAVSDTRALLRAKSGRGKTLNCARVALMVSKAGGEVLYVDSESAGSTTLVAEVENPDNDFSEEDTENIEYIRVDNYDGLMNAMGKEGGNHDKYDLIVVDTLDHKHTYAIKKVTDAQDQTGADWNEYPRIYSSEKQIMEQVSKSETNFLCTLDPESGSFDKPKGAQANIHGYFDIVVELTREGDDWGNVIRNWIGKGEAIGKQHPDITGRLAEEFIERIEGANK